MKIKKLNTLLAHIAWRIRSDLVMQVAADIPSNGGHFVIWVTEAGNDSILWQMEFTDGRVSDVVLPSELTNEKE